MPNYIYIVLNDELTISNVFEHEKEDLKEQYRNYMLDNAKEIGLIINPHWLNAMNFEDYHAHLASKEYSDLCKKWRKFSKKNTFGYFLEHIIKAEKKEFFVNFDKQ